jgi:hypothetical protein
MNFTGNFKMTTMKRAELTGLKLASLVGLLSLFPTDDRASAAHKLCPQPECYCADWTCIKILPIKNPIYVHFQVVTLPDHFVQVRQPGRNQLKGSNGETLYVPRGREKTDVSIQQCFDGTLGSKCSAWVAYTLRVPTANALAACEKYADKAVATYKQAKKLNCGYEDGFWSGDRKAHYNWCANLPDAERHFPDEHSKARQQGLNDCQGKIASANAEAAKQKAEAAKNFTGTWSVDLSGVPYTFVLRQDGPSITGQLVNADPTLNGTIQGSLESDNQRVAFSYVQPQSNTGGHGRFWMEITKDKLGGRFFFNGDQAVRLLEGTRK